MAQERMRLWTGSSFWRGSPEQLLGGSDEPCWVTSSRRTQVQMFITLTAIWRTEKAILQKGMLLSAPLETLDYKKDRGCPHRGLQITTPWVTKRWETQPVWSLHSQKQFDQLVQKLEKWDLVHQFQVHKIITPSTLINTCSDDLLFRHAHSPPLAKTLKVSNRSSEKDQSPLDQISTDHSQLWFWAGIHQQLSEIRKDLFKKILGGIRRALALKLTRSKEISQMVQSTQLLTNIWKCLSKCPALLITMSAYSLTWRSSRE